MLLNPQTKLLVQVVKQVRVKTFRLAPFLEHFEKPHKLFVRPPVPGMGRTPIPFHACFLKFEMRGGVRLKKIHQVNQKFGLLPARVGAVQHALQMIDIIDQHPVLLIYHLGTGRKLFSPNYHVKTQVGLPCGAFCEHR
jgi:hypothetical protein